MLVRACNSRNMYDDDWINGFYLLYKLARHAVNTQWVSVLRTQYTHTRIADAVHISLLCHASCRRGVSQGWHIAYAVIALSCMFGHNSAELNAQRKCSVARDCRRDQKRERKKKCEHRNNAHIDNTIVVSNWINCVHQSYPFGNIVTGNLF